MVKRKYEDVITKSITNNNKKEFEILIFEKNVQLRNKDIYYLEQKKLTWINKDNYRKCQFENEYIKKDYMFQFDDVDHFLPTFAILNQLWHFSKLVFHNALKCLMKYLSSYPFYRYYILRYAR